MNITLSYNNFAEALRLPVLPEEIEISTGLNNNTVEVVNLGEIGVIGNRKLNTVTLSSFFPKEYNTYCQYREIPDPYEAIKKIEGWRDSKRPIRLKITGTPMSVNMACMIEGFNYREKGGQPGDVYYELSLKEYRFITPRPITQTGEAAGSNTASAPQRPMDRQMPVSHTVKPGESLYIIAKRYYNDGNRWRELHDKNKGVIGDNPNVIQPGRVLTL